MIYSLVFGRGRNGDETSEEVISKVEVGEKVFKLV
jgi:hypothetical protein